GPHRASLTRVGRILRQTGIDGLPQLINVLRGDMSIVGPRAFETNASRLVEEQISFVAQRHRVKPGLTGWAQVNGHWDDSIGPEAMQRQMELDLYYVVHRSTLLDLKIIARTLCSPRSYSLHA